MKTKIILFLLTLSLFTFAQSPNVNVQQITNIEGDARNPFIPFNPFLHNQPKVFFEFHTRNKSNIYAIEIYPESDSLSIPMQITSDSLSINPVYYLGDYGVKGFLFFQTRRDRNWDIAYKEFKDGTWLETKFVANSPEDETDPALFFYGSEYYYDSYDTLRILYSKDNSIYMAAFQDTVEYTEMVFNGADSVFYLQPTGITYKYYFDTYAFKLFADIVAKKIVGDNSFIVHKKKNITDNIWGKEMIIDSGACNNPQFMDVNFITSLSYEKKMGNYYNIIILSQWDSTKYGQTLKDSLQGDLSNLKTTNYYLIIDNFPFKKGKDILIDQPYSYKYYINKNMFIGFKKNPYTYYPPSKVGDTLIQTRVKNTELTVGAVGLPPTFYVVWEDSINGHIQLFANKFLSPISDVNEPKVPNNFYLSQNYPNPFNPSTRINFEIPKTSFVTLKIFDVLGREVKTLINESKPIGKYQVEFDGTNLSSGIYFYRLKAGSFIQSKKMILLK